ncbi:MAG: NlpC/P60 family protein [Gaiellaceae bacterium]
MTVSHLAAPPGTVARHRFTQRLKRGAGFATAALVAFGIAAPAASAEPRSIVFKRAQARDVLTQVQSLDSSLSHAIDAYNLASERLGAIRADLQENRRELSIARASLKRAQLLLNRRVVALYTSEETGSTLDVVLGAESLADALDGIETADRVAHQDTTVLRRIKRYRVVVATRRVRLEHARASQTQLVAQRAAQKASIEGQLAQRQRLLSSIKGEIERLQAAEQARQAQLARQAQQRLAQQQSQPQLVPSPVVVDADEGGTANAEPVPAAAPSQYGGVVGIAMRYLGIPYRWGGSSPSTGFDCSGFIMYVYAQVGVSLPHNAAAQYGHGTPVGRGDLQPGDLVFFDGLGHNGIYVGGGQFIHSPHTGDVVKISSMTGWYASTFVGARRL